MMDLPDWLRVKALNEANQPAPHTPTVDAFHRAANEIERLRAAVERQDKTIEALAAIINERVR